MAAITSFLVAVVLNETAAPTWHAALMGSREYQEWAAPAALRDSVVCLWSGTAVRDSETLVLPDGCCDLIWERGKGAYVAGPDTGPAPAVAPAGTVTFGVRFRPAAGGPALGLPLMALRDQRVDLAELRPADARRLAGTLDPKTAMTRLVDLAGRLVADGPADARMLRAAQLLGDHGVRAEAVAAKLELSARQFRRRCHQTVGYGPKTLQRILRFRRFVSRVDAGDRDLATIAADAGYADQAHLTRECAELSGLTPGALARLRSAA
jgi:AraC-like DNA-binding protein